MKILIIIGACVALFALTVGVSYPVFTIENLKKETKSENDKIWHNLGDLEVNDMKIMNAIESAVGKTPVIDNQDDDIKTDEKILQAPTLEQKVAESMSNHGYVEEPTAPVAHCMVYGPECWTATPTETPN